MEKDPSYPKNEIASPENEKPRSWDAVIVSEGKDETMQKNQDSAIAVPEERVFAVCDGLGGHSNGDVASGIATRVIRENVAFLRDGSLDVLEDRMQDVLTDANDHINQANMDPERPMGTTVVLAKIVESRLLFLSLGDSRLYRRSRDGVVSCLTLDAPPIFRAYMDPASSNSLTFSEALALQDLLDKIDAPDIVEILQELSAEQLTDMYGFSEQQIAALQKLGTRMKVFFDEYFQKKNVVSECLGSFTGMVVKDVQSVLIEDGDEFMLVTDGLSNNLFLWEIQALWNGTYSELPKDLQDPFILEAIDGVTEPAQAMVLAARARSRNGPDFHSSYDDITAMIIR